MPDFDMLIALDSPYLGWDYTDAETAVIGVVYYGFEFIFFRVVPPAFVSTIVGAVITGKNNGRVRGESEKAPSHRDI